MECKFINHGVAISYDQVAKPCCAWKMDSAWKQIHHINKINLNNWHSSLDLIDKQNQLSNNSWPSNCNECQKIESQGRHDSMRGNGNSSYASYQHGDITLEIRPGSVCNFACQTCWPEASSRVAQYHSRAGLINIKDLDSNSIDNFEFLLPIKNRIRDVVLLGGEPFYDKSCKRFLAWAQENLTANLIMFTNGSEIDFDFLKNYKGRITLVFSFDAVGRAAEYVRYGTIWEDVLSNYKQAKQLVTTRVNITCSVYNYHHMESLMELLTPDWPEVVSFGAPRQSYLSFGVIPVEIRPGIISSLARAAVLVKLANIEEGQKHNAINALQNIADNLKTQSWNQTDHRHWCEFVTAMDSVKHINARDYCNTLENILNYVN